MVYLDEHLKKYPLMQIEDIIKLHLQGILGPAHLVGDHKLIEKRLLNEYEEIKNLNFKYEMIEEISDDYIRVYLKPYFEKYKSFTLLADGFKKSAVEPTNLVEYKNIIKSLINENNKSFINDYLKNDNILISHSKIYKDNYHPHYLVINKKYKGAVLNEI